jgi:DNA-binding transcriptional LysR family regulator
LEVFRTVAACGSITTAARRLRFTQSAVSRQIATLEVEVGVRLFDRLPRGVALTEQGRILLPHAEAILDQITVAERDLDDLDSLGRGRLRVGAFPTAVAALVPRALASFRAAHPEVALSLIEGLTPELLERLAAGDADVVVVSSSPTGPIGTAHVDLHHLLDEQLLVAVSHEHRLARRRMVRLADLADDAFIAGSANAEDTLLRASLPSSVSPLVCVFCGVGWWLAGAGPPISPPGVGRGGED